MIDKKLDYVAARFAEEIKSHELSVLNDNGVHRCLKLARPGSSVYAFFINTWPGHLCISGDTGCAVFNRLYDMIEFFRGERVNLSYWAEKIVSNSEFGHGAKSWDREDAEEQIMSYFEDWKKEKLEDLAAEVEEINEAIAEIESCISDDEDYDKAQGQAEIAELKEKIIGISDDANNDIETELEKIKSELIAYADSEYELSKAWESYESSDDGVDYSEFYESFSSCKSYTHRYMWQCHAIVWAIKQYDMYKEKEKCGNLESAPVAAEAIAACTSPENEKA